MKIIDFLWRGFNRNSEEFCRNFNKWVHKKYMDSELLPLKDNPYEKEACECIDSKGQGFYSDDRRNMDFFIQALHYAVLKKENIDNENKDYEVFETYNPRYSFQASWVIDSIKLRKPTKLEREYIENAKYLVIRHDPQNDPQKNHWTLIEKIKTCIKDRSCNNKITVLCSSKKEDFGFELTELK